MPYTESELVNSYYSDELTSDTEGNLIQLCRSCAAANRAVIQWAARGHAQAECELCPATNDPAYSRQIDALMGRKP